MGIVLDKEKWDFYLDLGQKFEIVDCVGARCKAEWLLPLKSEKTIESRFWVSLHYSLDNIMQNDISNLVNQFQ
jgi:hypothetical protein